LPIEVATDPTVRATSLAEHGSAAATADDGTDKATTVAPPAAQTANATSKPRRTALWLEGMKNSSRFADIYCLANGCDRWQTSPDSAPAKMT
jgi:hypothetical protein